MKQTMRDFKRQNRSAESDLVSPWCFGSGVQLAEPSARVPSYFRTAVVLELIYLVILDLCLNRILKLCAYYLYL